MICQRQIALFKLVSQLSDSSVPFELLPHEAKPMRPVFPIAQLKDPKLACSDTEGLDRRTDAAVLDETVVLFDEISQTCIFRVHVKDYRLPCRITGDGSAPCRSVLLA